ncbi:MAG: argininosuccinate lyase [Kiritimatiellae bacterium]|nr:argininosuccinate lyase [Kiritimatiellia bacterium]
MKARKTVVGDIDPRVLAFTTGRDPVLDLALVEVDCIGSAAHVAMLSRMPMHPRLFTDAQRKAVIAELVAIMRTARDGTFKIRVQDQDVHLAVERRLTQKLGDSGRKIHTARSRNDQVAVDLRLYGKVELLALMGEVLELVNGLLRMGKRFLAEPMVGRTHLQPAMVSSVGLWASAYAEALLDDMGVLWAAYDFNNRCPLGSAAGYGVPVPVDRALTSRLLGFDAPIANVLYASNARGKCESVLLSACHHVMITLSRLSSDLILYSMPEFGYFSFPREFGTGSSIMPQKNNPDVLELIRGKVSRSQACVMAASGIVGGLPGGYNRDLQEAKEPFMEGIGMVRDSTAILGMMIPRLEVHGDALRAAFDSSVFATDVALEAVASGVPFRTAYRSVKERLKDVECGDPDQAVARFQPGGPADAGLVELKKRHTESRSAVRKAVRGFHGAVSKLLGVPYPELSV